TSGMQADSSARTARGKPNAARAGCRALRRALSEGVALARCFGALVLILALAAAPPEADAQNADTQVDGGVAELFDSTPEEFVVANAQFVLMHELAHLVIDEKSVPILGPEESAADYIAAMM